MSSEILEIALGDIALSLAPNRQIRALRLDHVQSLVDESDPVEWDPIEVRAWPDGEPYPPGEEGRRWQVVSGYHRTTAARRLSLPTIRATVVDAPDDATFLVAALKGNTRHGLRMLPAELRSAVRQLADLGLSQGEIARRTSLNKSTVSAWLSGRDTNASKTAARIASSPLAGSDMDESSTRQPDGASGLAEVSTRQAGDSSNLTAREVTQVGVTLARVWAANLPGLRVEAVQAWLCTVDEEERMRLTRSALAVAQWLVAFGKECQQPRYTPEALADWRRGNSMSVEEAFTLLFDEHAAEVLSALGLSGPSAAESEGRT